MTNAPTTRKTHVIRILGTNKSGDVLSDIWADVERRDEAKSVTQDEITNYQGVVTRLKWLDDPDQDNFNPDGPPSRKMKTLKVCSPDEPDQSDPEEWIPIPIIEEMRTVSGDQGAVKKFINDQPTDARIVEHRRIPHYDTSIDDKAQAAFDADPNRKVFVVPGDQYTRDDSTKDDSQYLEHEIVTFLKGQVNDETRTGQGSDQGKQTKLLNQYLIDESEPAKLDVVGINGINPPWRLDPYQNIVNVKFSQNVIVVFADSGTAHAFGFQVPSMYTPNEKANVKFLTSFDAPYQEEGFQPGVKCFAYRVSASAGEFMTTVWPGINSDVPSTDIAAFVFAIDGDIDQSLARAVSGTKLLVPALYLQSHTTSDIPADIAPPGALWCVDVTVIPGRAQVWKIRSGTHRLGNNTQPPNKMVQCYPLGPAFTSADGGSTTWSGYFIYSYRLDRKGTGTVYGSDPDFSGDAPQQIDSIWNQVISTSGSAGIPFADPPPLINVDKA